MQGLVILNFDFTFSNSLILNLKFLLVRTWTLNLQLVNTQPHGRSTTAMVPVSPKNYSSFLLKSWLNDLKQVNE